jgi:hypothetical protein
MLPHEWLRTSGGYVKADGVDHHRDHFWPGVADIAWDVAAACVEFELDPRAADDLVARYVRLSADRDVARRLPFYRVAYLSFRLGYAILSSTGAPDPVDRARFAGLVRRYRGRLRAELSAA